MKYGKKLSIHLCRILRHEPELVNLVMDTHGWVNTKDLIDGVNQKGKFQITMELLEQIVAEDEKGRYRFNQDKSRIKACQGHTIPWVIPELEYKEPPTYLYHGTTTAALQKIMKSGYILKMERHAVHTQAEEYKAWTSAYRWKKKMLKATPVVLKIDAGTMYRDGFIFGVSDNEVWCIEKVPIAYICEILYDTSEV